MRDRNIILFDIDHTIFDASQRDHMLGNTSHYSWDDYHTASINDRPNVDIVEMVTSLRHHAWSVVLVTGRSEKYRQLTLDKLLQHNIFADELLMRPNDNFSPGPEVKLMLARERFGNELAEYIAFVFDNDERVIAAFNAVGVSALQVHCRRAS
jgi:phosphoglycolate phosphatase-like HAD superfamily hydrolase